MKLGAGRTLISGVLWPDAEGCRSGLSPLCSMELAITENTLPSAPESRGCRLPDLLSWRSLPEGEVTRGLGGEVSAAAASNLARISENFRLAVLPALGGSAPFSWVACVCCSCGMPLGPVHLACRHACMQVVRSWLDWEPVCSVHSYAWSYVPKGLCTLSRAVHKLKRVRWRQMDMQG